VQGRGRRARQLIVLEESVAGSRTLLVGIVVSVTGCLHPRRVPVADAPAAPTAVVVPTPEVVRPVELPPVDAPAPNSSSVAARIPNAEPRGSAEGAIERIAAPPVAEASPPPPAWDISVAPYETHERVAFFVGRFSGPMKPTFELALTRQSRYAPMIRAKLRNAGLPEDMMFLPLIESWYDPDAYSRAAAVGMWQFMTGTARGVGLRVDWWVDERRDPVRATDGAVRYLQELRETFGGSMYLAAAAYNGGQGRVSRGLERHAAALGAAEGDDLFFALSSQRNALRTETSDYVPKLIAAALVGKDPARYAVSIAPADAFAWDSVTVPPATPLAAVAKALAVPLDTLRLFNPHVLRGLTPPTGNAIWLRVPVGAHLGFEERFAGLPQSERTGFKRVVTRAGDYMSKVARAHGLTAKQLNWYNPQATRLKNGNLHAGQRILVPRLDVVRAARDVPDPKIERYGTSSSGYHVVKRGDTLGAIARRNGISVAALKRLNRLRGDNIRIGQRLRVR